MTKAKDDRKNTRAPALAREAEPGEVSAAIALPVAVVGVHVPPGSQERRNPLVLADAEIGPVTVRLGVFSMKRGRWVVRPPEAADRSEGVSLPPPLQEAVVDAVLAAVKADPEARAVLARWRPSGRP